MPRSLRRTKAAVLLVVLTGCGGGSPEAVSTGTPSPVVTTTPSTPTPTRPLTEAQAILAAYRGYWDELVIAGRTADFRRSALANYATDDLLRTTLETLRRHYEKQETIRGTVRLDPRVDRIDGATAIVKDCQNTGRWLVYDRNGRVVRPGVERFDLVTAKLLRRDGVWKVSEKSTARGACPSPRSSP